MTRIALLSLCLLLLVAPLSAVAAKPTPEASGFVLLPKVPEVMKPWCSPPGAEGEPWATRYPKEYQDWEGSVHGQAYLAGNRDVPDCLGCHGEPEDTIIRTPQFRLDIPARCAGCHDDEALTKKYDIANDVYSSYRADYHGATIEYYRHHAPSEWRYEAVCSDCHRSHAIYRSDDPRSSFAPANLLATCRRCHPKAEGSFTSITTGHFRTDREISPLAYFIQAIYVILIPTLIGLMLAYIGLDILFRLKRRLMGTKP